MQSHESCHFQRITKPEHGCGACLTRRGERRACYVLQVRFASAIRTQSISSDRLPAHYRRSGPAFAERFGPVDLLAFTMGERLP